MKKLAVFLCIFMIGFAAQCADVESYIPSDLWTNLDPSLQCELPTYPQVEDDSAIRHAGIVFDWPDISQIKRDELIQEYKNIVFSSEILPKFKTSEFKEKYQDFLKDPNYKQHYYLVRNGATTTLDANLSAFYFQERVLYMYAVQYKNNQNTIYYYNARGTLEYVDNLSENYPNYPYISKQYRINGKLVSAIYFASKDLQYMYKPNEEFQGIWYKDKMFDKKGKQTLTRTNW